MYRIDTPNGRLPAEIMCIHKVCHIKSSTEHVHARIKKMTVYNLLHSFHKGYYISVILHIIISIYLLSSISVALTDNI
jgi:hypothetical protein